MLLALVDAGVLLWVEDGRLRYRAPVGALDDPLRTAAANHRAGLIALVERGAVLPRSRLQWDEEALHEFEERAAILTFDAGMGVKAAEVAAERLMRRAAARRWSRDRGGHEQRDSAGLPTVSGDGHIIAGGQADS